MEETMVESNGDSLLDELLELYAAFHPQPLEEQVAVGDPPLILPPIGCQPPPPMLSQEMHQLHAQQQQLQPQPQRKITGVPKRRKMGQYKTVYRVPAENVLSVDKWAWRKYGQKPIKGSPFPRCSSGKGCTARKQVERSMTEPEIYVVTYTGGHVHPRPVHRNALAGISRAEHRISCSNSNGRCLASEPALPVAPPPPVEEEEGLLIPNMMVLDEDMFKGIEELGKWKNGLLNGSDLGSGSGLDGRIFQ